ncbi:MAG: hypothetical protein PUC12_03025 [Clostridiales bacterium]|nr:hypothetical protein [Clostridiales bacterium]
MNIRVYFMEVNENGVVFAGRIGVIKNTLQDIENYLGMPVKIVHLTEKLVVVMKQEMEQKSPVNRAFVKNGKIVEIFTGNLICVRQEESEFSSIEDEDVDVIRKYLKPVFDLDGQLIIQKENDNL